MASLNQRAYCSLLYLFIYTEKEKTVKHPLSFYCFGNGKALDTKLSVIECQYEMGEFNCYYFIHCSKCQ